MTEREQWWAMRSAAEREDYRREIRDIAIAFGEIGHAPEYIAAVLDREYPVPDSPWTASDVRLIQDQA